MKLAKRLKVVQYVALLVLVLFFFVVVDGQNSSLQQTIDQRLEEELNYDNTVRARLKRKRRYLEFPEGSSFQLVYDLIVGVVDYTNYLILGVTVALAWELPTKPPSEILGDLTDRLKDGTLGTSRNDTSSNIKYVNTKLTGTNGVYSNFQSVFGPTINLHDITNKPPESYFRLQNQPVTQNSSVHKNSWHRKVNNSSYKSLHATANWTPHYQTPYSSIRAAKFPWWTLSASTNNHNRRQHPIPGNRRFDQGSLFRSHHDNYRRYEITTRPDHRIFPLFGKRNVGDGTNLGIHKNDAFSNWNNIHIRHHRRTRYDLYGRIERYLDGRGSNGHHCVLRALCETGQKSEEQNPESFVGEIMRAIFTLPGKAENGKEAHRHGRKLERYDKASALVGDCALRYYLCKNSLWSSHLVI